MSAPSSARASARRMVRTSGTRSVATRRRAAWTSGCRRRRTRRPSEVSASWPSWVVTKPSSRHASTSGSRSSTSSERSSARSARSAVPPASRRISSSPEKPSTLACGQHHRPRVGRRRPAPAWRRRGVLLGVAAGHDPVDVVEQRLELGGAAVAGAVEADRDLGLDAAGVGAEHDDAVGEQDGLLDVVGDDQDRLGGELAARPQLEQLAAEVLGGEDVERAERLVHEQDVRLDDQRAGEAHALAHAAGELLGVGGLEAVEADQVDRAERAPGALGAPACRAPRGRARRSAGRSARAAARSSGRPCRRRGWCRRTAARGRARRPPLGGISPAMQRSSVDLPEPERPSSATISPSRTSQVDALQHGQLAVAGRRTSCAGRASRRGLARRGRPSVDRVVG